MAGKLRTHVCVTHASDVNSEQVRAQQAAQSDPQMLAVL